MAYIGKNPTSVPLTSSDIEDGIITTTKIADANVTNPKLTSGSQQNFRNIIINGDMSIAQRATSVTGVNSGGYYTCDRWRIGTNLGAFTVSQSTDVPSGQGFANSFKMDCTTAENTTTAVDTIALFSQRIEGQNLQYLKKGTSSAESLTASFWVKSNKTGTYILEMYDTDNSRTISKSYTIDSASTWEKKTLTFAGDTTGAFGNDNGGSLRFNFWLGAGTFYSSGTLATSWQTYDNTDRAVGQINLADTVGNELYITGVQLEAGTTASEFEFLPYDVNLQRCQRYYYNHAEKTGGTSQNIGMGAYTTSTRIDASVSFPTTMRSVPSLISTNSTNAYYAYGQNDFFDTFVIGGNTTVNSGQLMANGVGASGTNGQACIVSIEASNGIIAFNSEL